MKTFYTALITCLFFGGVSSQTYFSDDFEPSTGAGGSLTNNNAWTTQVVSASTSGYDWYHDDFSSDAFARVSNYNSGTSTNEAMETWLISPVIDLSSASMPVLSFNNMKRFSGTDIKVNLSTNYTGSGAPSSGTWTDITSNCTMDVNTGSWSFVSSGDVDLTAGIAASPSTVFLAFQYVGGTSDGSTYQIDDVVIQEGPTSVPTVPIYDIQFTTAPSGTSPYDGQNVNTGGIVTAVVNSGSDIGYFIQNASGAWNGVYVDDAVNAPSRGDSVVISGLVQENFSFTQLTALTSFNNVSSGNPEPAASGVSTGAVNSEDYESVLVQTSAATCTNPTVGFGQWAIFDGSTDTCLVDDVIYSFSPALGNSYDVTGPVWYSYSEYKLLPRDAADIVGASLAQTIYNIQFTTDPGGFSPLNGANVSGVKGIVTAESSGAFNTNDKGYWLQDGSGPWHGIFVWDTINTVSIGDSVIIDGNVNENFNQTIIRNVSSFNILNSGNSLPTSPVIATDSVNNEKYEGVLITTEYATCTNPSLGFGQWEINDGSGAALIDDVIYSYPSPLSGTMYRVTGPVYYSFSEYKILPRAAVDVDIFASIKEQSVISNLYPNPATEMIVIEMTTLGELLILDISGKVVQEQYLYEGKNGVEIGQLSTGTYIAKIKGRSNATIFHVH